MMQVQVLSDSDVSTNQKIDSFIHIVNSAESYLTY